ncbi:hypothetical protein ILYODFUR_023641, partial [Ilyodon furcidens]
MTLMRYTWPPRTQLLTPLLVETARQAIPPCPTPAFSTFLEYRQKKNKERQKYSLGRKGLKDKGKIKVGLEICQTCPTLTQRLLLRYPQSLILLIHCHGNLWMKPRKVAETENGVGDLVLSNDAQQVTHLNNRNNPGTPECLTVQSSCYRNYSNLFEPIVIDVEDDVEDLTHDREKPTEEPVETYVQAREIIAHLALAIDHKKVSRFNICRSEVWDRAVRGFQRSMYSDKNDMFIKFNDDAGCFEKGLDAGGPRREFLTLLMSHLRNRPIFYGLPENSYLVCNPR